MSADAQEFESDPFTDAPFTYDQFQGRPNDAFNIARGTFRAPVTGTYLVNTRISWVDPKGIGRDVRLIKLNDDGSPGATLIGPSHVIDPGGDQEFNQQLRLQEGDEIQLTVANQADDGRTTGASMSVVFVAG